MKFEMKKIAVGVVLATGLVAGGAQAAILDVAEITITGGDFRMNDPTAPADAISGGDVTPMVMGTYQGEPSDVAATSLATFPFGFFGPVGTHTADNLLGGQVNVDGGALENPAAPSGTVDDVAGTIALDLGSWFAYWSGTAFNQGNHNVTGTYTAIDASTGAYDISWTSLITGGAFDGQTGYWNMQGVATVPVPAAAWLFGSALLGLVGVARRKKAA